MSGSILIGPALLPQAAMLAALHAESFGVECWSTEQFRGSLALTTTRAWLARADGKPAGFILCQILPEEAEILTLCVSPARRRSAIGESLLRQAMADARDAGARILLLEVAADNLAARKLYERLGFLITGTRANYYKRGAVTVDAVMYGCLFELSAQGIEH